MSSASALDAHWVVPAVPELKVVERDSRWLCLNPEVPAWLCTTKAGALILQLIDGSRSIEECHAILAAHDIPLSLDQLVSFFKSVNAAKFFEKPQQDASTAPWESRRLRAMYLHLTNRCNLQCVYCYRESSPHLPILHDARRFCEMFEYVKPFAAPNMEVTFSGGEPLMHPGFRDIVEASVGQGYSNVLLTNATLLTDESVDFIRERFRFVKISLDGPTEETHSQTRGKGNFSRVLKGIFKLAEKGVRVKVQVTFMKSTLPHLNEIKRVFADLPNVSVVYTPLLPMGRGAAIDSESIDNDTFYDFAKGRRSVARYIPGQRICSCHAGVSNLSIADTGDVYPCHHFHAEEFRFGNIFHDPLENIFFGEAIKSYIWSMDVEHNNPECQKCEVRFLCGGGCHANNLHATGSHRGVDIYCSYLKRIIYDELFDLSTGGKQETVQQV
jgi:radical SAM protein with 4Fe4S-binding SPASM domain